MPDFDGGHAFITTMFPIRTEPVERIGGEGPPQDRVAALREVLSLLPTAKQSPASDRPDMPQSPFARLFNTHFARFVVMDDVVFNGRDRQDALSNAAFGPNLTVPVAPADHLATGYLVLTADIDAPNETEAEADAWARELWAKAEAEMRAVFTHCEGFQAVRSADDFAGYLRKGRVETTMSFNDYFEGPPPLKPGKILPNLLPALIGGLLLALGVGGIANQVAAAALGPVIGPILILLGVLLYGGLLYRAWRGGEPIFARSILEALGALMAAGKGVAALLWLIPIFPEPSLGVLAWATFLGLAALVAGAAYFVWWALRTGSKSLPAAPNSDLKSVLKALYLQQRFIEFAVGAQGADAVTLHKAFGEFLKTHKPSDVDGPTQPPGVVRSPSHVGAGR